MDENKKEFVASLIKTNSIFFKNNLTLKDGRPTPYFVNIGKYSSGRYSYELGRFFCRMIMKEGLADQIDIIIGPSYKGSAIAQAVSIALYKEYGIDMPFDYDRKEAKLHGEATGGGSLFVNNHFFDKCRIFLVDDVATSMGTKYELVQKISTVAEKMKITYTISGLGIAVDREQTSPVYDKNGSVVLGVKGEDPLMLFTEKTGIKIYPLIGIREAIEYIYRERIPISIEGFIRPMDEATKLVFDNYMATYGVDR